MQVLGGQLKLITRKSLLLVRLIAILVVVAALVHNAEAGSALTVAVTAVRIQRHTDGTRAARSLNTSVTR